MADCWIIVDDDDGTHESKGAAVPAAVVSSVQGTPMFEADREEVGVQTDVTRCTSEGDGELGKKGAAAGDGVPTSVTRVSISLNTDATASVAPYNVEMKNVLKTVLTAGKEFSVRSQVVFYVMIGAMRDWCDGEKVYELVLNKEVSTDSGGVVPFVFTGADDQYDTIIKAIDNLAKNGCHGGGDNPEEYSIGVSVTREFMRKQRELYGDHPQFALFCTDDVAHGFSDTRDSYQQGTGEMPLVNKDTYLCPYAPHTDEVSGQRMFRGGNPMAGLGNLLDDDVKVVWCTVGAAAASGPQYEKWLVALTSCMEKTKERTGFVFRYQNQQDAVPSTISTLFLHLINSKSVPDDMCDVKREDFIRKEVDAVLKATARTLRDDQSFPQSMLDRLEGANALLVDNLNNLAAMSLNDAATRTQIAEAAEGEGPRALERYRSLAFGRSLSNPVPYDHNDATGYGKAVGYRSLCYDVAAAGGEGMAYRSLSYDEGEAGGEGMAYRSLSYDEGEAGGEATAYRSLAYDEGEAPNRSLRRKLNADYAESTTNAHRASDAEASQLRGFDRKDAIRRALMRW